VSTEQKISELEDRIYRLEQALLAGKKTVDQKLKELELEVISGAVAKLKSQGII
jgi:hypothetical protein